MQSARSFEDVPGYSEGARPTERQQATEYEFNSDENSIFSTLASAMRFVGTTSIVLAALIFLGVLNADVFTIISAVVQGTLTLVVGIWLRRAAGSIDQIVTTEGGDIANLMSAMTELRKVYRLQRVLIIVAVGLIALAFLLALAAK